MCFHFKYVFGFKNMEDFKYIAELFKGLMQEDDGKKYIPRIIARLEKKLKEIDDSIEMDKIKKINNNEFVQLNCKMATVYVLEINYLEDFLSAFLMLQEKMAEVQEFDEKCKVYSNSDLEYKMKIWKDKQMILDEENGYYLPNNKKLNK